MPKSLMGWVAFAVTATLTVIVGLSIYNRLAARVPKLASVVNGNSKAA